MVLVHVHQISNSKTSYRITLYPPKWKLKISHILCVLRIQRGNTIYILTFFLRKSFVRMSVNN